MVRRTASGRPVLTASTETVRTVPATRTFKVILVHGQEALVLGVLHVLLAPEQGELVLVGMTLLVGAEHGAVAALVAHAVDMYHLMLGRARHLNGNVGAVGAHVAADLAHRAAAQAAGLGAVALVAAQRPPLRS